MQKTAGKRFKQGWIQDFLIAGVQIYKLGSICHYLIIYYFSLIFFWKILGHEMKLFYLKGGFERTPWSASPMLLGLFCFVFFGGGGGGGSVFFLNFLFILSKFQDIMLKYERSQYDR